MSNDLILYGKKGNSIEVKEILTHGLGKTA